MKVGIKDDDFYVIGSLSRNRFHAFKRIDSNTSLVPISMNSIQVLKSLGAEFSEEATLRASLIELQMKSYELAVSNVAAFKEGGRVPESQLIVNDKYPLGNYQRVALANLQLVDGYCLFMEQGTGKTPIVIADICNNIPENRSNFSIIVCPNAVRLNWVHEIEKFKTCDVRSFVLRGSQLKKIDILIEAASTRCDAVVLIVGYDTLPGIWDHLSMFQFDGAYLDESHYVKAPKSKRAKYVLKLRDIAAKKVVLTGTPIANTHLDLYMQFEFIGKNFSGFSTWEAFKNFYGTFDRSKAQDGMGKLVGACNLPLMKENISRYSIQFRKEEVLESLPPKVYDIYEVEMTGNQAKAYQKMLSELMLKFENGKELQVMNYLTMMMKLAQITSGFVYTPAVYSDEGELIADKYTALFDNPKLIALKELLANKTPQQKTIVWACFREDLERISQELGPTAVLYTGKDEEVERFNCDPETKVFIANPASAGLGLNLLGYDLRNPGDTNCDHMIYFSQDWSYLKRDQSESRCHRRGTRVQIRITDICVPNSIDETIRTRVVEKKLMAHDVADVRAILKELYERWE